MLFSEVNLLLFSSPDENNLIPYLRAMGHLKNGIDTIEKGYLHSCDKTVQIMVDKTHLVFGKILILTKYMLHLETIIKHRHGTFGKTISKMFNFNQSTH
jgi:hypothetical protein